HVGDMYVPDTAIARRGHFRDVLLYPFVVIERRLITDGFYEYFACSVIGCRIVAFNLPQLARLSDECLVGVIHVSHRGPVDGDDVFTRFRIHARSAQGRNQLFVPALAGEDAVNAVVTTCVTA